jgi:hypothetical protein
MTIKKSSNFSNFFPAFLMRQWVEDGGIRVGRENVIGHFKLQFSKSSDQFLSTLQILKNQATK